ncbi:MAG: hypothetical protein ACFFDF_02670 [Candidatus Odinarchaeota archaeon]
MYGTAYLDSESYITSFGTENSEKTLIAYSDSLRSNIIYSNIDPLDHISWEMREDNYFAVSKHVLLKDDIVIVNPITYNTTLTFNLNHLYDRGFGLPDYVRLQEAYYYNTTTVEKILLYYGIDYLVSESGQLSFPEYSSVHMLYNNTSEAKDEVIYFTYTASEFANQLSLTNADGFFINFTMPALYYDHTTIQRLSVNFYDQEGNCFTSEYYDLDLRKYFMDDVKANYEVDIFGLGKMMAIPLYIDFSKLDLSNPFFSFNLAGLDYITFTISDSLQWPGSFIQNFTNYSIINLPYQRVGILDLKLYNLICDSIETDEDGYISAEIMFKAPDYYDFYANSTIKIKRLNIEFTDLKVYAYDQEILENSMVDIEYSDFIELNYRWNDSLSPVMLNGLYYLPITMENVSDGKILAFSIAQWITKTDWESLSGYLTKYYYSRFEVPQFLGEFNVTFGSLGTPIYNITFKNAPMFTINITQESLLSANSIYLSNGEFYELEYGHNLFIDGCIRDNDEYIIEDAAYQYNCSEASDGNTVYPLDIKVPLGDHEFIDREEFSIYYINNDLEILPLYSSFDGNNFTENTILNINKKPEISYIGNTFILTIYWNKYSSEFINYDTLLLISCKVLKGRPIRPISYSPLDSYGHSTQENLIEVPFARYDMITHDWITEDDFTQRFLIEKQLLSTEIETSGTTIQGPQYNESIRTGIIDLHAVYVNKSYSDIFKFVEESKYNWSINQNGELVISNLNYSAGDVFRVEYFAYYPFKVIHPLNDTISSINYFKIINSTGYEYECTLGKDYTISDDGYTIYFYDLYNLVLKRNNFSISSNFEIKYHSSLSRKIDLSSNLLLMLQDSQGNDIPIDTVPINSFGFFEYDKQLRIDGPLTLPLGGGKKLVHMALSYLPTSIFNKSSGEFNIINYKNQFGNNIYPYIESNKWVQPITVVTIPDKVMLEMVEDITQDMVVEQQFIEERKYLFNYNPVEALEAGEEYTKVMIDALAKEEYEFTFKLSSYENELDEGTPIEDSIVWLQCALLPKSKTKFLNERAIIDQYEIHPYFESLGTEEITFRGPGDSTVGANKMYGRPLTYDLEYYNTNYSAYGPYYWMYAITNERGEATFKISFDHQYLKDFTDIFGSMEGFNSVEDVVLYIRAFSSYFEWEDFIIDSPDQYLCSKDGQVFDGSTKLESYDFTKLATQDSTYCEGLIHLHKNHISLGANDYISYNLPDLDIGDNYKDLVIYLYGQEANPIPDGATHTLESLTKVHSNSELEATSKSIFDDGYTYYAYIEFINPSGNVVNTLYKEIQEATSSGYITVENDTMISILNDLGPGVSTIRIQIDESEYYKRSSVITLPLEIKSPEWLKFGEKNMEIDLIDPFINAYGNAFDGDVYAPFESNYDHLIGTVWVDPDFLGTGEEKERSIQDYVEISLMCNTATLMRIEDIPSDTDEDKIKYVNSTHANVETDFPLREGIMLRPGNRDGIMMFDIGLGVEDAFLLGLACKLNLTFDISYNSYDIYKDNRDIEIYLLDLRLEKNPSSNTPNITWSIFDNEFNAQDPYLGFSLKTNAETMKTQTGGLSLGGVENGVNYGVEVELNYDPQISRYSLNNESELYGLIALNSITPIEIRNESGNVVTSWTQPYSSSENLKEQAIIEFGSNPNIENYSDFTIIYQFNLDYGENHYANITLGSNQPNKYNASWIEFTLPEGFLPKSEDSHSSMFVRYNKTIIGDGGVTYDLDYGIQGIGTTSWNDNLFIIYNSTKSISSKTIFNNRPRIVFAQSVPNGQKVSVIYGVRSQYDLGYGFQKLSKSYSDSVRLLYNNDDVDPIIGSSALGTHEVIEPSLYIGLDNSSTETILELYNIPLLFAPEINCSFVLDPVAIDQINNFKGTDINTLSIKFYYVASGSYGSYYTDSIEIPLNYTAMEPDLESGSYIISYTKDLQNIFDAFGSGSGYALDIYISITQIGDGSNFIPYIILEQFDYLCDEHLVEMYSREPVDGEGNLDVSAVINTPHYHQILSRPFIDGTGYGESPFNLLNNSEVTVGIEDLPYSSIVALEGSAGNYNFNYLGTRETLRVSAEDYYIIPNMALYTDAYNIDQTIYQDGFVNLYYGSGTQVSGEHDHTKRIYMDYDNQPVDEYESSIASNRPTSWEDIFNITDQFLTTQEIRVSGTVLYHQLFDLTSDYIDNSELENILDNIEGVYFGVQIPDEVSIAHVRTVGKAYAYDLSIQGFPMDPNDYDTSGTYCKVITNGTSHNFDERAPEHIMDATNDYSLEFASNGSKYLVFYTPLSTVQTYSLSNKIMVDYWAYYTFAQGFDFQIIEDPLDPYTSTIDWDYEINSPTSYDMHPDFTTDTSFTIEFSALEWNSIDNNYIHQGEDEFTFKPEIQTNITVMYYGDENESFSILNTVPDNQYNDSEIFKCVYVRIWDGEDQGTAEIFKISSDPIIYDYICQDENCSFYYWINFTKCEQRIKEFKPDYELLLDSFAYIELHYISDRLRYSLSHTPFNYKNVGAEHTSYHLKLSIEGKNPIYSYQSSEWDKYVLKIENNMIYFKDEAYGEEGYIANKTKITLEFKYKLQPGLISQEHFLQVIYPWTNVFSSTYDEMFNSNDDMQTYRERMRKISGSSIISPFEYSLSIEDTYSLYLSYRLNQRELYEKAFKMDYRTGVREFYYLENELTPYISEYDESLFYIYYYNEYGEKVELDNSHYTVDTVAHKIIIHDDGNPIITPNDYSEFFVKFIPKSKDFLLPSYRYTYNPSINISSTLALTNWDVINGEQFDVIPNFNAQYYLNQSECTFTNFVGYATQISSFLEENEKLRFDIENELSSEVVDDIHSGDYIALYINTIIDNYECLEGLTVELLNSSAELMPEFTKFYSREELEFWDFKIKINLPTTSNELKYIQFTPSFRDDSEYCSINTNGIPHFEYLEWDIDTTQYDNNGNLIFIHPLERPLLTNGTLEIAYIFDEELHYLNLPQDFEFNWSIDIDPFGREVFFIHIPSKYINPDNSTEICNFDDGEAFILRYNTPVEKMVQIGVEKMYFNKKPYNFASILSFAEIILLNTSDSSDYNSFGTPYSYNISLPLTPFNTEYLGSYMDILLPINLTTLQPYMINGSIDFSHVLITVPNPAYELTIHEFAIIQESQGFSELVDTVYNRVWQYNNKAEFTSDANPEDDQYHFTFSADVVPLFYNNIDEGKWLQFLKIYDENYNYYSAGTSGDEYQLHWNSTSGNFVWNNGFDKFQDYWGTQIELPAIIDANTTLYFEYCSNNSWSEAIELSNENIDAYSIDLSYNYEYFLTPKYEDWYGDILENNNFDYKIIQYYAESFSVYNESSSHSHIFDLNYDLEDNFHDLSLYKVVGVYPNLTTATLESDSVNYEISFDKQRKNVTITDLNAVDGLLNQFDSISIILNFSSGPISSKTQIFLSNSFNQTYLLDPEASFYDYLTCSFAYSIKEPIMLLAESEYSLTSDFTSFTSINYTKNTYLGTIYGLNNYETSLLLNFQIYEDPYNTIYECDLQFDGEVDYKQEIDIDKDNRIDITRYGVDDPEYEGEIIWYRIIQDYETTEKEYSMNQDPEQQTRWFDLDECLELKRYDLWALRTVQKDLVTLTSTYTKFYSVRIDEDLDGYANTEVAYHKVIQTAVFNTTTTEKTLISGFYYNDPGGSKSARKSHYQYIFTRDNYLLPEYLESGEFPENFPITRELLLSYSQYERVITFSKVEEATMETITVSEFEEGEITQVREYRDNFVDELSLFNSEPYITSLSITHSDTEMQLNSSLPLFLITDPTQINWTTETWSEDKIPLKFDTKITTTEGESEIENYCEETITIRITNRFSLYHDYLNEEPSTNGDTLFKVKSIFITPSDGMVYYTSDKEAYKTNNHEGAKIMGHYLYYDSDSNGFWETVFILTPDDDGDGVYDVFDIAYNYDGQHSFIPYEILNMDSPYEDNYVSMKWASEIVVGGIQVDIFLPEVIDAMYPKDSADNYVPRDHIFEIYKLSPPEEYGNSLFIEVYYKQYGEAWAIYEDRFWNDLWEQVAMITTAGTTSAVAMVLLAAAGMSSSTGYGLIVGLVFAAVYFLLSWELQEEKRYLLAQQTKAREYFTINSDRSIPTRVNRKTMLDASWEHYQNHPSAKFLPVSGGVPGKTYTGDVIVHPSKTLRNTYISIEEVYLWTEKADLPLRMEERVISCLENYENQGYKNLDLMSLIDAVGYDAYTQYYANTFFDLIVYSTNVDYFLLTSELPSYSDKEFYSFDSGTSRDNYYRFYRSRTLGYLEQEVNEVSEGEFNAIKPICINGRPSYIFINDQNENSLDSLTQPLSPLYQPIIISDSRYDDPDTIIPEAVLSVDVKSQLLNEEFTSGIDSTNLTYSELKNGFKAKIPLSVDHNFTYPISKITIDVMSLKTKEYPLLNVISEEFSYIFTEIEIDPSYYCVKGGNLYFTKPIDKILALYFLCQYDPIDPENLDYFYKFDYSQYTNSFLNTIANWKDGQLFYRVNLHIQTVMPYTSSDGVLDATTDNYAKIALAQSIQYSLSDFMGTFALASKVSQSQADMDYTTQITAWSTLISSLVLVPIMATGAGFAKVIADTASFTLNTLATQILRQAVLQLMSIPIDILTEVYEELYIDSIIEESIQKFFDAIGGDSQTANFLSSLICSFREAFFGGNSPDADLNLDQNTNINENLEINEDLAVNEATDSNDVALDQTSDIEQSKGSKSSWKTWSKIAIIMKIGLSAPGMFVGGLGLGLTSLLGEFAMDHFQDLLRDRWAEKDWDLLKHKLSEIGKLLQTLQNAKNVPRVIPKVKPNFLQTTSIVTSIYSHSYLDSLSYQRGVETLQGIDLRQDVINQKVDNIEHNLKMVDEIYDSKVITDSMQGEVSRAAIAFADPKGRVLAEKKPGITSLEKNFDLPKIYSIPDAEIYIANLLGIKGGINIYVRGQLIKFGQEIRVYENGKIKVYELGRGEGKITTLYEAMSKFGYNFNPLNSKGQLDPDLLEAIYIIPTREMYNPSMQYILNPEPDVESEMDLVAIPDWMFDKDFEYQHYGASYIIRKLRTLLHPDLDLSDPYLIRQLNSIYDQFIDPLTKVFSTTRPELMSTDGAFNALERFITHAYKLQYSYMKEFEGADLSDKNKVNNFIQRIFNEKFTTTFEATMSRTDEGRNAKTQTEFIENIFLESIQYAAFTFILEKIGSMREIDSKNLVTEIESFFTIFGKSEIDNLVKQFLNKEMSRILLRFAESFFTGTTGYMSHFDMKFDTQIGWELETLSFVGIAPFFLIKEFIQNGYKMDNLKFLNAFVYDTKGTSRNYISQIEQIISNDLSVIINKLHNGADLFNLVTNFRLMDLITVFAESHGFVNFECKNSMDSKSSYIRNVIADIFSTIYPALYRAIDSGNVIVEGVKEHMIIALDANDENGCFELLKKLVITNENGDIIGLYPATGRVDRKGNKLDEFYTRVAREINKRLSILSPSTEVAAKQQCVNLLTGRNKDLELIKEIKNIGLDIFNTESMWGKSWLQIAKDKLALNLNYWILKKDLDGIYKINLETWFNVYTLAEDSQGNPIRITQNNFRQYFEKVGFFLIPSGGNVALKTINQLKSEEISGTWVTVHRKTQNGYENGLLLSNTPEIQLRDSSGEKYYNGFKDSNGEVTTGFITKDGYLLFGQIRLNPQTHYIQRVHDDILAWILYDKMQSVENIYLPYARDIEKIFKLNYIRSAFQEAGDKLSLVLQDVISYIIPTGVHEKLVKGSKTVETFKRLPSSTIEAFDLHPITTDELLDIYIDLCQYKKLTEGIATEQSAVFSLLGKFKQLNMRMIITNEKFTYDDSLARSDYELNEIINKLRRTINQDQFNKLFYRDENGNPYRKDQFSIKAYLENFRNILMTWKDPGEGNRDSVDELLYYAKFLIDNLDALNTGTKEFSQNRVDDKPSELERGLNLLNVAQFLFGAQSFRLMLLRSLWYFRFEHKYKILPMSIVPNHLLEYIQDLNMISSRQNKLSGEVCYTPIIELSNFWRHLPSYLFGNSFLYLPIDGDNTFHNAYYFGYGPMPVVVNSISVSQRIDPTDVVVINQDIGHSIFKIFDYAFENYKIERDLANPEINRVNLDIKSYEDIYSVVERKVIDHFTSKSGDVSKNLRDAYNILIIARRELLSFTDIKVKNMETGVKDMKNLRVQFLDFFRDPTISTELIKFYGSIVDGKLFSLKFSKNDFGGKFTQMNGNTDSNWWSAFDIDYIEQYNKEIIDKRVEILKDLIVSQAKVQAGSKKVRIFIGQNIGIFEGTDYGYQYIEATKDAIDWIPKTSLMLSTRTGPSYVDISFENGADQQWEITKLRYLVLLSLAIEQEFEQGSGVNRKVGQNFRDFIFVIKKADATVEDQNYIAYFNHKYIRSSETILPYSNDISLSISRRSFRRIELTGPYTHMFWSNRFASRWVEHSTFIPIWTTQRPIRLNIFSDYEQFINHYKWERGLP